MMIRKRTEIPVLVRPILASMRDGMAVPASNMERSRLQHHAVSCCDTVPSSGSLNAGSVSTSITAHYLTSTTSQSAVICARDRRFKLLESECVCVCWRGWHSRMPAFRGATCVLSRMLQGPCGISVLLTERRSSALTSCTSRVCDCQSHSPLAEKGQ